MTSETETPVADAADIAPLKIVSGPGRMALFHHKTYGFWATGESYQAVKKLAVILLRDAGVPPDSTVIVASAFNKKPEYTTTLGKLAEPSRPKGKGGSTPPADILARFRQSATISAKAPDDVAKDG